MDLERRIMDLKDSKISHAFEIACLIEVSSPKPGNIYPGRSFSDLHYRDFLISAAAASDAFNCSDLKNPGRGILKAVENTHLYVDSNTNLGIILLCVPVAAAFCQLGENNKLDNIKKNDIILLLKEEIKSVLNSLTKADAEAAYQAINLSRAGNLSKVKEADIREEVNITLLEAMRLAEKRDKIAAEYAGGFALTLDFTYPRLKNNLLYFDDIESAVVQTYLEVLSRYRDSLIFRKYGSKTADLVSQKALKIIDRGGLKTKTGQKMTEEFDGFLRSREEKVNPGTTADLITAALFLSILIGGPKFVKSWTR
ncbi:triphosphoribosyl-dephospho-CoA synthase [Halanaerobium sp. MA284_MarDTE_T2]|uniref:triphosphoribosyl-dephospho-CoA synthase n=1 Tax=Halanaerobium sp. MA284_MarDTE_T2 TaxID=2183913 RepID=UPI000DF3F342|nr:triphosphoribosyl-dephospho-CoA synthase [Halanaerobium sp. MA284_MarDTE_T2]RCW48738.1 triphosphoribosyl-dephospho-CoA synthase [Halanaerobium sp. MA284_MarDTE_T2]